MNTASATLLTGSYNNSGSIVREIVSLFETEKGNLEIFPMPTKENSNE